MTPLTAERLAALADVECATTGMVAALATAKEALTNG